MGILDSPPPRAVVSRVSTSISRPLRPDTLRHLDEVFQRCPALAPLGPEITRASKAICACYDKGGTVLVCGNGGSASDSEHIVGELAKGFILPRVIPDADADKLRDASGLTTEENATLTAKLQRGVAAISLTGHPALTTAIGNDTAGHLPFAQQVYVYGRPGDVLIGLSTSGNSANVVHALGVARALGLTTIGFTGSRPARFDALCDILLKVPAAEVHKIQELHLPAYHTICLMVEQELFGAAPAQPS